MTKIQMITADEFQTSERFYALPKILFESDRYKQMRIDTKVAYAILKDRLSLSLKNNWIDEAGYIYLVYSNANLMEILNCSKSTLLRIKKQLLEYGLIYEVKQSNSQKGTLANRIYLGQLIDDKSTRTLVNNDFSELDTPPGVRFRPGGYQIQTRGVSDSDTNDTDYSDTNISDTDIPSDDDEEMAHSSQDDNYQNTLNRKVDEATQYDRDYIWGLVYDRLRQEGFSRASADFVMRHFDDRYQYALENMRYADSTEKIAEFVFNGILAVFNQEKRKQENANG
ncbi:replication initiator protein A [Streptococcus salivarius]|uniref:replication initiator protein A n=1 Tax=Streptococcus salivarius TaxID=1304 RepID=UPI000AD6ADFD|nr:replication initiator protein A [Streptococcus salivarius]